MCGRFTLRTAARDLVEVFELLREPELTPRFNIAPMQPVARRIRELLTIGDSVIRSRTLSGGHDEPREGGLLERYRTSDPRRLADRRPTDPLHFGPNRFGHPWR